MSETHDVLIFHAEGDSIEDQYSVEKIEYKGVNCVCVINKHHMEDFRETYKNPCRNIFKVYYDKSHRSKINVQTYKFIQKYFLGGN